MRPNKRSLSIIKIQEDYCNKEKSYNNKRQPQHNANTELIPDRTAFPGFTVFTASLSVSNHIISVGFHRLSK